MSLVSHPTLITLLQLYLLATVAKDFITSVYLNWTVGRYGQCFDYYHLNIMAVLENKNRPDKAGL